MRVKYHYRVRTFSDREGRELVFSEPGGGMDWKKSLALTIGAGLALKAIPAVIRTLDRRSSRIKRDEILIRKNDRLNRMITEYNDNGVSAAKISKAESVKYFNELSALVADAVELYRLDAKDSMETVYETTIVPFLGVLKAVLIPQVWVITGETLGADRRKFEMVYDPDHEDIKDILKDQFRMRIFTYPWPSHGYDVAMIGKNGQMAVDDANQFINATLEFLSKNPTYLGVRVK